MIMSTQFCPRCGLDGELYIKYCPKNRKLFFYCEECDTFWLDPPDFTTDTNNWFTDDKGRWKISDMRPIPGVGCSMLEIEDPLPSLVTCLGWGQYLRKTN